MYHPLIVVTAAFAWGQGAFYEESVGKRFLLDAASLMRILAGNVARKRIEIGSE